MTHIRIFLLATMLLSLIEPAGLRAQQQAVSLAASKQVRRDGSATYQYTVVNNSKNSVARIVIGVEFPNDQELDVYPVGWAGEPGIPKGSSSSPNGWSPVVIRLEGSNKIAIQWEGEQRAFVQPGQTLTGFSVTTQKEGSKYLTCHWTAFLTGGSPVTGILKVK